MGREFLPAELPDDFWNAKDDLPPVLTGTSALLPAPRPGTTTWTPQKLQFWYDGIIDLMIARPGIKLVEIAKELGKTPVTIGLVVRSDMFKLRYEERRKNLAEAIDARVSQKLAKVAEKGLDAMLEHMETKPMSIGVLKEVTLGALDRLGYGPQGQAASPAVVVNNHAQSAAIVPVSADVLREARESMAAAARSTKTISHEGEVKEGDVLPPPSATGGLDAL